MDSSRSLSNPKSFFGKQKVWMARGQDLALFNENRSRFQNYLRHSCIPESSHQLWIDLCRIGLTEDEAKTFVVVSCIDRRIRKLTRDILRNCPIFQPGQALDKFKVISKATPPETDREPQQTMQDEHDLKYETGLRERDTGKNIAKDEYKTIRISPSITGDNYLCRQVQARQVSGKGEVRFQTATAGPLISLDGRTYQLTVAHVVNFQDKNTYDAIEATMDDWDEESDDDANSTCSVDEDVASWDTSAGRNDTPDVSDDDVPEFLFSNLASEVATQQDESGTNTPEATSTGEEPVDKSVHPFSSPHPHISERPVLEEFLIDHASPSLGFAPSPEKCQISTEMDCLLIPINADLQPGVKSAELVQISEAFDLQGKTEPRSIIIATASLGYTEGVVFPAPSLLRPPGSKNFQTLYCIKSDNAMPNGTSGSAVFDKLTGLLAGYLVLGCPEKNIWYMVPILDMLNDMQARFRQKGKCQIRLRVQQHLQTDASSTLSLEFITKGLNLYDFDALDNLAAKLESMATNLSDTDPQRASCALEAAKIRFRQYKLGGNLGLLDNAIGLLSRVFQEPPPCDTTVIEQVALALGHLICAKNEDMMGLGFLQPWSSDDLDRQVANMTSVLSIIPNDNPYFTRFEIVLNQMKSTNEESKKMEGDVLHRFGGRSHQLIQQHFGKSPPELKLVLEGSRLLLEYLDPSGEERYIFELLSEGERLLVKNCKDNVPEDLDLAIERYEEAINLNPRSIRWRTAAYIGLANCFSQRYRERGEMGDLEKAISNGEEAENALPEADFCKGLRGLILGFLGDNKLSLFQATGRRDFLDTAVANHEEALKLADDSNNDILSQIHGLSSTLLARYAFLGDKEDLYRVDKLLQRPEVSASGDAGARGRLRHIHSAALAKHYEQTKDLQTLDLAIKKEFQALDDIPSDHHDRHKILSGLALLHEVKYTRLGADEYFQQALKFRQQALEATPRNSTSRGQALIEKGKLLTKLYETHKSEQLLAEIDDAITEGHSLLARSNTVGSQNMRTALEARAWLRLEQHKRIRGFGGPRIPYMEGGSLDQAIGDLEAIVMSQPESNSSWIRDATHFAGFLALKAKILASEGEPSLAQKASNKAGDWYTKVLYHPAATPLEQIRAVHNVLIFFTSSDPSMLHWKDQAADFALRQLPHVCNRDRPRESQQEIMKAVSEVASSICSLSIKRGRYEDAMQRIEYGRELILGHLIDRKDNIKDLKKAHQDLAQRYEHLREQTFQQFQATTLSEEWEAMRNAQAAARANLKTCEDEIRLLPGFENFQRPIPVRELQAQAKYGPIVIVNVSGVGWDAIIMTESKLDAIPLPEMKKNIPTLLQKSLGRSRSSDLTLPFEHLREGALLNPDASRSKLLTWLWKTCVLPVVLKLRELGELVETTNGDPPRVWWIGTGAAASLPFHAAGDINRMSSANLGPDDLERPQLSCMDWMTPSYAASIKSLQYARRRATNVVLEEEPALLVVAMPTTPGHSSLLGVETEKKAIEQANAGFQVTSLVHPSSEEVLAKLHSSSIAHFACHGMSHPTDLDASYILLRKKGSNDRPEVDRLTVSDILDLNSHGESGSWLVYLSACPTGQVKSQELDDVNMHLASALQIAGFSHAVGSLWSANDGACAEVARFFYEELSKYRGEDRKLAVAGALRRAIMKVRGECVDNPDYWAPFVHFGA